MRCSHRQHLFSPHLCRAPGREAAKQPQITILPQLHLTTGTVFSCQYASASLHQTELFSKQVSVDFKSPWTFASRQWCGGSWCSVADLRCAVMESSSFLWSDTVLHAAVQSDLWKADSETEMLTSSSDPLKLLALHMTLCITREKPQSRLSSDCGLIPKLSEPLD